MKYLIPTSIFFCCFLLFISTGSFGDDLSPSLTEKKVPAKLLEKYDSEVARKHPEHGILPFNAPCSDCIELLEKRTPDTREFVGGLNPDGSRQIYMQKSLGDMSYKDKNGFLITSDPRLFQESDKVFAARNQPNPVVIDLENKYTSITNSTGELRFNKNIALVFVNAKGEKKNLGAGDWSHVVKSANYTETTILIQDFYPGVDLQMVTAAGRVKTSFILKNKLEFSPEFADGWLTFTQQIEMPKGLTADLSASETVDGEKRLGSLNISDAENQRFFDFTKGYVFDGKSTMENYIEMPFTLNGNKLDYYVPVNWLNSASTVYPVTVDPFVNSKDSLLQAVITGSGYTTVCDSNGCSYFLNNVMTPPNCEITAVETYYSYLANLPCIREDGGFSITMTNPLGSSCTSRHYTCLGPVQGACFFFPAQLLGGAYDLSPCLLPPQCASYPLDFEMKFRRCHWIPILPCDNTCILANSNWIMNIVGRTVELTNVTFPQTICEGQCTNLAATGDWGVPIVQGTNNYTFTWQPGGAVGDVVNVCPTTTTHYTVTLTDLCGITDTGSTDVTVIPIQNPGFTISPNDTVCTNTPMTFSGGGAGAASSYDWIISCPAAAGFNDTQNLNYTSPGTTGSCTATLTYQVQAGALTCNFSQTQTFVVEPGSPPLCNITYVPNGLCPGQAVTFTANVINGGSNPTFQWSLNGVPVAGATNILWATNALGAQFTVSVFVTSNSTCANPDTVTAGIVVPVSNAQVPSVIITAAPNTICPGQAVTFTAAPTNGGGGPIYQWTLNGTNIGGATNSTYTGNPAAGDIFGVIMTSNSPCVNPPTANDTETVAISANIVPTVSVTADQPNVICAGTVVTFTANPANGGPAPTFQWQLAGVNIPGATNINYTDTPLGVGGIYGVIVTSSLTCANPNNATDTILITVVPAVVPAVSITASIDTVCSGDPVVFTAVAVNGGANPSYQWTVDGILQPSTTDTMHVASPSTSYNVSVQIISNAPCASPATATANYSINVRPTPVPAISITLSDDTVCAGTPVTFTSASVNEGTAPTYQWLLNNNPIVGATNTTYNTTPGATTDVYSVTLTSNALCVSPATASNTANVVVISNASPDVQVSSNVGQIVCDNTPMTFTAAPTNGGNNPGFQWLLNGTQIAGETDSTYSPPLPVVTGSIFECVLTTSFSCAVPNTDNDTLEMTILPIIPTTVGLTATDDTICAGTSVTFTASPTGGGPDPAYSWTINGSAVPGNDTSFLASTTMNDGDIVGVTMTSTLPCSVPANTTYTIFVTPTPVPGITQVSAPPSVCAGDVLNFTATGVNGGPTPTYQWFVNGNPVAGATNDTYSDVLNDGDIVTVEMTSNAPCVNPPVVTSNQIVALVIPYVTPDVAIASDIVNDTICLGQNVTFTANGNNGGPSPSYTWYVNGVDQGVSGATFTSSTLVQGDVITAMLTSSEQCLTQPTANSNQILINVFPPLNLIATGSTTICPYEPVTLNAFPGGGDGGPYGYDWSNGAGTTATVIVTPGITTQYNVIVTDNCNSNPVTDSVLVTVNPSPEANLSFRPLEPSSLAPDVIFHDLSFNPITWQWSFGDGDSSYIEDPAHTYAQPGEYDVTLVVSNIYGCIDSITYKVIVKEDISVFIPNSFTPNSDGRNEFFTPMGTSLEDFDFWIFDRWGVEIFHGNETNPWRGLSQKTGKPAPEDVYVYKVDLKYSKFGKRYVTGRVSLIY
ncbi:MAG: PKD domain-containing protein [Bacteroidota bacterium]